MKSEQIIEKIRNKLKDANPETRTVLSVLQFNFTDDAGKLIKSYVFNFKELNIYEGTTDAADGEITITDEDFHLVASRQIAFDELLSQNKAEIKGDAEAIDKFMDKFRAVKEK